MTIAPSLVKQRLGLQGKLQAQRREVVEQLTESRARSRFPRSITMRVLVHHPELAGRLVALIAGARVSGSVSAFLVVLQALRAARIESHDR